MRASDGAASRGRARRRSPAISTSSPGSKPPASSARMTPMPPQAPLDVRQRLLVARGRSARSAARSASPDDAEAALAVALDAEAAAGRGPEDLVLGERPPRRRVLGGRAARPAGTRRSSSRRQLVEALRRSRSRSRSTGTSSPSRSRHARGRRVGVAGGTRSAFDSASMRGRRGQARVVRGQLALDRRVVVDRVGAVERREVEHVHEQRACARRGRGSRGRARRRRWRPRSARGCRRARAGGRRPRACRAPARAS